MKKMKKMKAPFQVLLHPANYNGSLTFLSDVGTPK
jgi:hypothetical protein